MLLALSCSKFDLFYLLNGFGVIVLCMLVCGGRLAAEGELWHVSLSPDIVRFFPR